MFANLSLKQKLMALEAVSFSFYLLMLIFGLLVLRMVVDDNNVSILRLKADMEVMADIDSMDIHFLKEVKIAKDVWLRGHDEDARKKYRGEFVQLQEQFGRDWQTTVKGLNELGRGHEEEFAGFIEVANELKQQHAEISGKYLAQIDTHHDATSSDAAVKGIDREFSAHVKELREGFVAFLDTKAAEKIALAEAGYASKRLMVFGWAIFSILIILIGATVIIRQVMRQLGGDPKEVAAVVNIMATGDFSRQPAKLPARGSLLADAYDMQNKLRASIDLVKSHSVQVGEMAHTLAVSANQIASNVKFESDAVSNMAATIEELSVSTTHISDQGAGAKQIANNSRQNAEQGAQVVNKTVTGLLSSAQEIKGASAEVSRLGEDASRISDVVKVIKEIADQTNLLALNAAIEAARAGEQGRGFAVVADEVRKLAERTAGATSEINQMSSKIGEVANHALSGMDKVVKTTQQGVGDAESAQVSIQHIQENFGEVAGVIDEIAVALDEQNAAATELAKSTERVSQMSEENSGAAQNLLHLANDLEAKAREVRSAVEVFKV